MVTCEILRANSTCEIILEEGYCQKKQGDSNGNGAGDACECYADFNGDSTVSVLDIGILIPEFGRPGCPPVTLPCPL